MASPEVLDLAMLLEPISSDNPAGESVRYMGIYDEIQEARRADDDLNQGVWQTQLKVADWPKVITIAAEALATKSKDLQIGAWLVEALTKHHGFAGLRDGLKLLCELNERFWSGLYPEMEDGDLEFRAGPLTWLNEKLPTAIRGIALTNGDRRYAWHHWDESQRVDSLRHHPEAMQAAIAEGKITGEQFERAIQESECAFFEFLVDDVAQSRGQLSRLTKIVDEKFGRDAPSLVKLGKTIDDCHGLVCFLNKKRKQYEGYGGNSGRIITASTSDFRASTETYGENSHNRQDWADEPHNREDAFQRLALLASYLKRVEPQHPVTYLVERAVRWTKMPLDEWLSEVVSNPDVLKQLRETLGIKNPDNV